MGMQREGVEMEKENAVRLGLIGLGSFSVVIAGAVERSRKAELVTCYDVVPERRRAASQGFGCAEAGTLEEVLRRDDIDGVLIVAPNAVHCELAVAAARHGKHVFVEKPIANTLEDGMKMIEACRQAGVVLLVGHDMRRFGGNRKIRQLIDQGAIGKPIQVEANISSGQGWGLTPNHFRWRGDDSGCPGGAMMTMGIHQVDSFHYFLGPIRTVSAFFSKLYIPAEVEDVNTAIFKFSSGVLGYLGNNFASPKSNWLRIYGTEANLQRTVSPPDLIFEEAMKNVPKADLFTKLEI
jgi:predicted dehydrogenase